MYRAGIEWFLRNHKRGSEGTDRCAAVDDDAFAGMSMRAAVAGELSSLFERDGRWRERMRGD